MDLYQQLAAVLLATCPDGHNSVQLNAELDEGWAQIDLRCRTRTGAELVSPLEGGIRGDIYDKLDALRTQMFQHSGTKWKTCSFAVDHDGKFKFQVGY